MTMYQTDNLRIQGIKEVAAPSQVHDAFPITETAAKTVHDARESVHNILHGTDDRIVIIVGSLFGLFIVTRVVRAWARRVFDRVPTLSRLLSGFLVMAVYWITIAFGLRNVTHKQSAINSMYRALKPGGRLLILEFSRPAKALRPAYDFYSFNILPRLGRLIARDEDSYRYLAESIRMHPDQQTLIGMMEAAGFERCSYQNLAGGIVALHIGYRI